MDASGTYPILGEDDPLFQVSDYTKAMSERLKGTWTAATLSGAWVAYVGGGGYYNGLRYRKVGDMIHVQGMVKSGAVGSSIATLPSGFRPQYSVMQVTEANAAGTLAVVLFDAATGAITYRSGPAAPSYLNINITLFAAV